MCVLTPIKCEKYFSFTLVNSRKEERKKYSNLEINNSKTSCFIWMIPVTWNIEIASEFSGRLAPELQGRIKRYKESIPLFTRYQVESQIETAYQREVQLNNGGSVIIDQ